MSLTLEQIERIRNKRNNTGSVKTNDWGTDASGYQKYYDSRELPVLKRNPVKPLEVKGENVTIPASRLDLMKMIQQKRTELENKPIPSLKNQLPTNSALNSKKQADSPIITSDKGSSLSKWSANDYKLSSDEKSQAKKMIDDYYKNEYKGNGNLSPEEQKKFEQIVSLENKVSTGAALMAGIVDSIGLVKSAANKFLGANEQKSVDDVTAGTKIQNPVVSTAGNVAGTLAQYGAGSQLMQSIPAVANMTGKAGQALSKLPVLNKVGAESIANVLGDTMLDVGLDTLPRVVSDVQNGKNAGQVAGNALKNLGTNLAFNVGGEAIGVGLNKLIDRKSIPTNEALDAMRANQATKQIPKLEAEVKPLEVKEVAQSPVIPEVKKELPKSKLVDAINARLDSLGNNYQYDSKALRDNISNALVKANAGQLTDAEWEKVIADIGANTDEIKNAISGKALVDDVKTAENVKTAKANFNTVKKAAKNKQVYLDNATLKAIGLGDKKKLESVNNWLGVQITKNPSGENVISATDFLSSIPDSVKANIGIDLADQTGSMKNVMDYMSSTFKNTMSKKKSDIPYQVMKYGDDDVKGLLGDINNYFDELNQINKSASQAVPQNVLNPLKKVEEIPQPMKEIPVLKQSKDGQMEMNIPVGKERGYAESIRTKTDLPDEIKNEFVDNPEVYEVLSNATTKEKADFILASNTLDGAKAQFNRLLTTKDAAAIPLGYEISKKLIDAGNRDEAVELLRNMSKELTKGGQFTQAAAITMMKNDPMTALRFMERQLDSVNATGVKKFGKDWKPFELSEDEVKAFGAIDPGDSEGIKALYDKIGSRISKEYPVTKWEKTVELARLGMLFSTRTQERNVIANAIFSPIRSVSDRVSALGQNVAHLINPDVKVTQSLTGGSLATKKVASEVWDQVKGTILNNSSKWNDLGGAVKDKQIFKGNKISEKIVGVELKTIEAAAKIPDFFIPGVSQKVADALKGANKGSQLEALRQLNYYLLEKGDDIYIKNNFVNRLASYMQAQGIKSIDEVPEDAISIATQEALKATFKDDNWLSDMLKNVKKNTGKFGEVVLPFTKTPANLAMRAIDYSPIGVVKDLFKGVKNGKDLSKIMDDISKGFVGSAGIALGYYLAKEGIIQGSLSDDKDEAAFQKQQGKLPYSFNVNGNYYTYDWAPPSSTSLILGTAIYESMSDSDKSLDKMLGAGLKAANSWIELSPLQSLADVFGGYGTPAENIMNEIAEFPQRLIPAQVGAVARIADTTQRSTFSNGDILKTQIDTAKSKIPVLSKSLPVTYDTWGNEVKRSDTTGQAAFAQLLNPGQFGNDSKTPIDDEISRLFNATENKGVFPKSAAWKVGDIKLDNAQHSEYQKEMGSKSLEIAKAYLESDIPKNYDDTLNASSLEKIYGLSDAIAKQKLFGIEIKDESEYSKLAEVYSEGGVKAVLNKLEIKNAAIKYNIDDSIAERYISNKKLLEKYSLLDQYAKADKNNKNEAFGAANVSNKLRYMNKAKLTTDEMGQVLYDGSNSDTVDAIYDEYGTEGVYNYYNIRNSAGDNKISSVTSVLKNSNMTENEKGVYLESIIGQISSGAKNAKAIYGNEGVYQYYLHKQLANADNSDQLSKSEIEQYLAYQQMADEMKRTWERLLSK